MIDNRTGEIIEEDVSYDTAFQDAENLNYWVSQEVVKRSTPKE